jgi:LacI family transcriptional regulator
MSTRVRLSDIARASEVSASTVSLVLRNKPGIPEETRRRVLAAAEALGYRRSGPPGPSPAAPDLQSIGLLVKSDAGVAPNANPFYSQVLAGIEDACRTRHVNLLYATLPVDEANRATGAPRFLATGPSVDGLLVVGALVDAGLHDLLGGGQVPLVLVDAYTAPPVYEGVYDAVLSDNFQGAAAAVTCLLEHGHVHIGMVGGGDDAYPSLKARRHGYRHALRAAGVPVEYTADCMLEAAEGTARQFLLAHPQITAIFACNDHAALSVSRVAQSLGRRIPDDLSLIGFDDIDLAAHVQPPLTTMHVDKVAMGRLAVQLLEARLAAPSGDQVTALLRPRLVVRSTVAPLGTAELHQVDEAKNA